ncbi:MAG: response regulator transcription factor [Actinomycetia bacterium]|nr:response regulator transcription factor [Actinomycetes bacterium]
MVSVFLVDDHDTVRAGTRAFLSGFDVVGEAATTADAIAGILDTRPDVALVDVHLDVPKGGARVVAAVKEVAPEIKCVAFTVSTSRSDVAALLAAGVDGYITKSTSGDELPDVVRDVMNGGTPVSREVASYLLDIDTAAGQVDLIGRLTPREREVVMFIARGYTYRESAAKLGMKVKTLESHMAHIFEKLGVATRAELSFLAYETGMVDPLAGRASSPPTLEDPVA